MPCGFFPFFTKELNTFTWVRNMRPGDSPPWLHFGISWTNFKKYRWPSSMLSP